MLREKKKALEAEGFEDEADVLWWAYCRCFGYVAAKFQGTNDPGELKETLSEAARFLDNKDAETVKQVLHSLREPTLYMIHTGDMTEDEQEAWDDAEPGERWMIKYSVTMRKLMENSRAFQKITQKLEDSGYEDAYITALNQPLE